MKNAHGWKNKDLKNGGWPNIMKNSSDNNITCNKYSMPCKNTVEDEKREGKKMKKKVGKAKH